MPAQKANNSNNSNLATQSLGNIIGKLTDKDGHLFTEVLLSSLKAKKQRSDPLQKVMLMLLESLKSKGIISSEEQANALIDFVQQHSITYLGGNNSKNFKIENIADGSIAVLKAEVRPENSLEASLLTEARKRVSTALPDLMVKEYGRFSPKNTFKSASDNYDLVVNDILKASDVQTYIETKKDDAAYALLNVCTQMNEVLLNMEQAKVFFPDSKATNWMMGDNARVCLADTKSLLPITDIKDQDMSKGYWQTYGYSPPHINNTKVDISHFHAHVMGINMSRLADICDRKLSGSQTADIDEIHLAEKIATIGKELTRTTSSISLKEAQDSLNEAHLEYKIQKFNACINPVEKNLLKDECSKLFDKIFASQITKLKQYEINTDIEAIKTRTFKTNNISCREITVSLNDEMKKGSSNTSINAIFHEVQRHRSAIIGPGHKQKAQAIENALNSIITAFYNDPKNTHESFCLSKLNKEQRLPLDTALASHRHFWRSSPIEPVSNNIDPTKAARAYQNVQAMLDKAKLNNQAPGIPSLQEPNNSHNSTLDETKRKIAEMTQFKGTTVPKMDKGHEIRDPHPTTSHPSNTSSFTDDETSENEDRDSDGNNNQSHI